MGSKPKIPKQEAPPPPIRETAQDVARAEDSARRTVATAPGMSSTQLASASPEELQRRRSLFGQ